MAEHMLSPAGPRQEVMIKALNILLKYFTAIKPNETLCMGLSQF